MTVDRRPRDEAPRAQGARGRLRRRARDRTHTAASRSTGQLLRAHRRQSPYATGVLHARARSSGLAGLGGACIAAISRRSARRRSASASSWRTRSRVMPRMRPISSSDFGSSVPLTARSAASRISLLALRTARRSPRAARCSVSSTSTCSSGVRLVAREQVAERRGVVLADRLVERRDRARRGAHLAHLLQRQLRRVCELLVGRRALELRDERRARPARSSARARRCAPGCGSCAPCSRRRAAPPGGSTTSRTSRT